MVFRSEQIKLGPPISKSLNVIPHILSTATGTAAGVSLKFALVSRKRVCLIFRTWKSTSWKFPDSFLGCSLFVCKIDVCSRSFSVGRFTLHSHVHVTEYKITQDARNQCFSLALSYRECRVTLASGRVRKPSDHCRIVEKLVRVVTHGMR